MVAVLDREEAFVGVPELESAASAPDQCAPGVLKGVGGQAWRLGGGRGCETAGPPCGVGRSAVLRTRGGEAADGFQEGGAELLEPPVGAIAG